MVIPTFCALFNCRENRHLLFLTENYAALTAVLNILHDIQKGENKWEPYVLFGSSFPKDREYTQVSCCQCSPFSCYQKLISCGPKICDLANFQ